MDERQRFEYALVRARKAEQLPYMKGTRLWLKFNRSENNE
jgi:hypothetical protein